MPTPASSDATQRLTPGSPGGAAMPERIGRFQIRRLLGRGTQSAVHLAFDPHLEREVAIKMLAGRRDPAQDVALLKEARTVSKLRHPNIVPIFEAGEHGGESYLVFEFVEGRTLERLLRDEGALPGLRAAEMMKGILDALDDAHRNGIVHRDLKPSNVLVNEQGLPRVMDFGIATPLALGKGDRAPLCGSPAYMAPEYIAQRTVTPQCDVYAAGLVLFEMVFGRRAIQSDTAFGALHKIANEDLQWPEDAGQRVDEKLRDLIAKATVRDPQLRFQSAAEMRQALDAYLTPLPDGAAGGDQPGGAGTVEFLLRRMRHKTDFPSMSTAITTITRLASSERGDVNNLSNSILKDFALTNKILRISNSALYRQFASAGIGTVSRAIVVLGFNTIRNIAMSLVFLDHLQNKPHAERLREEFLRVSLSGMLARRLAEDALRFEPEESFICAQFHNLGRLLTHYYFPEEAEAIAKLTLKESCGEEVAATKVLGIGYQDLGVGIARSWGFPEAIVQSMYRLPPGKVAAPRSREDRLRALSGFANELCVAIEANPQGQAGEMARLRTRFGDCLPISDRQAAAAVKTSVEDLGELARIVKVDIAQTRLGKRLLLQSAQADPADDTADADAPAKQTYGDVLAATAVGEAVPPQPVEERNEPSREAKPGETSDASGADAEAILSAGIQDISNALVEDRSLGSLLGIALEIMYRAMGFRRVLLCMRDGRTGNMCARFGFGHDADEIVPRFRFPLADAQSIFNVVLNKDVDVLISDASDAKIVPYVPEWFRREVAAPTFIVFPLRVRGVPVAMIYADKERAGEIVISAKELGLLRTLRNQVLLAIKQAA
ncbi:MAG: HDOD domain-containing protein [Nevskia sp.]|nr:HDOD domain-containing protein [Nevskia sp.]